MNRRHFLTGSLAFTFASGLFGRPAEAQIGWARQPQPSFEQVIAQVVGMPHDRALRSRAQRLGLDVVNLTWEDTARYGGSSVGPNISDLTLQVRQTQPGGGVRTHLLPVIRHPNFSDRTADVPLEKLWVRVGNHREGAPLVAQPLTEVLSNLREYLTAPDSLRGSDDFLTDDDTHALVSAQHVFLPIPPKGGEVEFNPVLFNYQSSPGHPAVLTLLVTREGTSATIIENRRGDQTYQGWGQQLFFNQAGQRTAFTAERKSAVERRIQSGQAKASDAGALEEGADMMMIVQVPLKVRQPRRAPSMGMYAPEAMAAPPMASASKGMARRGGASDVEQAVLGHGDELGPFSEMGHQKLERDSRFPIRVTVQFYKATSNGVVSPENLADVKRGIDRVYAEADYVGSLVVPKGERHRPTDWQRPRRPRLGFVY